jgi:hypothetical protein
MGPWGASTRARLAANQLYSAIIAGPDDQGALRRVDQDSTADQATADRNSTLRAWPTQAPRLSKLVVDTSASTTSEAPPRQRRRSNRCGGGLRSRTVVGREESLAKRMKGGRDNHIHPIIRLFCHFFWETSCRIHQIERNITILAGERASLHRRNMAPPRKSKLSSDAWRRRLRVPQS